MKNNKDFKFVIKNEPSEEVVKEFHKQLAKGLINKHGEDFVKEVLKSIETNEKKE